jgi:hypothetical protein
MFRTMFISDTDRGSVLAMISRWISLVDRNQRTQQSLLIQHGASLLLCGISEGILDGYGMR